jgi:hypothetical protein
VTDNQFCKWKLITLRILLGFWLLGRGGGWSRGKRALLHVWNYHACTDCVQKHFEATRFHNFKFCGPRQPPHFLLYVHDLCSSICGTWNVKPFVYSYCHTIQARNFKFQGWMQ